MKRNNPWGIAIVMLIVGFFGGLLAAPRSQTSALQPLVPITPETLISRPPLVLNLEINGQKSQIVGNPLLADPATGATLVLGEATAKITMVEFTDYLCSFCHLYTTQTFPKIVEQYVKTGKVRYIVRHTISVGGDKTVAVANIAACANEQKQFWGFHGLAHASAAQWSGADVAQLTSTLITLSQKLNLNTKDLTTCVQRNKYTQQYNTEIELSRRFGVTGTPSFVIGGYFFSGALPFEVYQKIFETLGV